MAKTSSIIVCILFATVLHAQGGYWQQLNGPTGGYSQGVVAGSDGTIYLATHFGELWKRSPQDVGWKKMGPLPFELDGMIAQPLFAADGKLFLMNDAEGGVVEFTTDGGRNWELSNASIYAMAAVHGILYGIDDGDILRSTDSGVTWKRLLRDTTFSFENISASKDGRIYAAGGGVYINVQGDSIWQKVITPGITQWAFVTEENSKVCIGLPKRGYSDNFFRTTDGGATWDSAGRWVYNCPIAKDSSGALWTVMGFPNQVMVSYDSGATWINVGFPHKIIGITTSSLCVGPSNDVYLRTDQHVYHYSRDKLQWSQWEDSLDCGNIYAVLPINDDTIVVSCNQGFCRTADGGQSWSTDSMDIGTTNGHPTGYNPSNLFRDHEGYLYSGPSKYDPQRQEWIYQHDTVLIELNGKPFGQQFDAQVLAVDSSDYIYSPGPSQTFKYESLLRSSDHGNSWQMLSQSPDDWIAMAVDSRGRILASIGLASTGGIIIRSSDHGETWDTIYHGSSGGLDDIGAIVVSQDGTILAKDEGGDASGPFYMIESNDDGALWQHYDKLEPWTFALDGSNKLYAAGIVSAPTLTRGVLISTDTGKTGQLLSFSTDTGYSVVAVSPNHVLYAGTLEDGLFHYVPAASSVETVVSSPENFTIFPNPATDKIQITSAERSISILDPLGRSYEVKQTGNTLDVSSLPPGVYFVSDGHTRAKFVKE